jgi:hypothetical protein
MLTCIVIDFLFYNQSDALIIQIYSVIKLYWEDNIKMDLQNMGGGCGDWMELAQDRERWRAFVSTVMNFRFP